MGRALPAELRWKSPQKQRTRARPSRPSLLMPSCVYHESEDGSCHVEHPRKMTLTFHILPLGPGLDSDLKYTETWVQSLGGEVPLEEDMATHSSILAWEIPWTEEPGGLQSMRVTKELGMTEHACFLLYTLTCISSNFFPNSNCFPYFLVFLVPF